MRYNDCITHYPIVMYSREPIWLTTQIIVDKYDEFCFKNNLNERMLLQLYNAFLLRGRRNGNSKKIEILQESFENLQDHIIYNLFMRGSKEDLSIRKPDYLKYKYKIFYDSSKNWYTPSEILETYPFLKYERAYTTKFIGDMAMVSLVIGKYQPCDNCYYISLPSFVWLMKYHEYTVRQYLMLPPDDPSQP